MALILSIETSTQACSVALHQNQQLIGLAELFLGHSHSVMLTTLIQNAVKTAGFELKDLSAIAIAKGPGSYTGLRIGTATTKGLCYALDKPLIAVNTLQSMAYSLSNLVLDDYLFCPMIDARRMEVYCGIWDKNLKEILPTEAKIIDENSFVDVLDSHKIIFFGDGANKCKTKLSAQKNAYFIDDFTPTAKSVGVLAWQSFENQAFEDLAYFEPFYLKDFIGLKKISY